MFDYWKSFTKQEGKITLYLLLGSIALIVIGGLVIIENIILLGALGFLFFGAWLLFMFGKYCKRSGKKGLLIPIFFVTLGGGVISILGYYSEKKDSKEKNEP